MQNVAPLLVSSLMIFVLTIFTILLFHKGRHNYSNKMLAFYLIFQIIGIGEGFISSFPVDSLSQKIHLYYIFLPFTYVWGPTIYFYLSSVTNPEFRVTRKSVVHFLPAICFFVYFSVKFYFKDTDLKIRIIETGSLFQEFSLIMGLVFSAQIIGYNIWGFIKYLKYKSIQTNTKININYQNWVKLSVFGFIIACFICHINIYLGRFSIINFDKILIINNLLFLILYSCLFYYTIINPVVLTKPESKEKYKSSNLTKDMAQNYLETLSSYMLNNKPFTNPELTLKELAYNVNIPERLLSQVINEYKNQNFYDFINSYRVEYAKQLLQNPDNEHRTMLDIYFEAGFNSKATFNYVFKKITSTTPSAFRKKYMVVEVSA